jgi:hypothetical protein
VLLLTGGGRILEFEVMSNKNTIDDEPDDYDRLLVSIDRTFEQDQRVAYHELGHIIINRVTGTDRISFISITPSEDHEGICRGARTQAFVKAGATGPGCLDAADVRQVLAPMMPKPGEPRSDKDDIYASVLNSVTELMAGEAAEQLTPGDAQHASDDRRQAAELAALICKTPAAIERFIEFALQQAIDVLSEHITVLWSLGIILRMRRDMTGADTDQAMATILAGQEVALERFRRRQWRERVARAADFQFEPLRQ